MTQCVKQKKERAFLPKLKHGVSCPKSDEATRRKILAEWDAIDKWTEEEGPRILKLEDEASQLASERLRIINEYGFETEKDFLRAHRNDYETWVSDESLTPLSIFRR